MADGPLLLLAELVAQSAASGLVEQADASGLDDEGIVALVTSTLRDFSERRDVEDMRGDQATSGARQAGGVA